MCDYVRNYKYALVEKTLISKRESLKEYSNITTSFSYKHKKYSFTHLYLCVSRI